jgi:hypothetical protein
MYDLYVPYTELCHKAKRWQTLSMTEFAALDVKQQSQIIKELEAETSNSNSRGKVSRQNSDNLTKEKR